MQEKVARRVGGSAANCGADSFVCFPWEINRKGTAKQLYAGTEMVQS